MSSTGDSSLPGSFRATPAASPVLSANGQPNPTGKFARNFDVESKWNAQSASRPESVMGGAVSEAASAEWEAGQSDLHSILISTLADSGVTNDVKPVQARLRAAVVQKLLGSRELSAHATHSDNKKQHIVDGIIAEHMTAHEEHYGYSLSVLTSERPAAFEPEIVGVVARSREVLTESLASRRLNTAHLSLLEMILAAATTTSGELLEFTAGLLSGVPTFEPAPLSNAESLQSRLGRLEFSARQRDDTSAFAITQRMQRYQQEVDARAREEIATTVAGLRATEIARMRAEERARYDVELSRLSSVLSEERRGLLLSTSATLQAETASLGRQMTENDRAAMELRARLLADMDAVAARDRITAQQAALNSRELALERRKMEDMERTMLSRVREAEERATYAESNAKLALERWKTETKLEIEERQRSLANDERRLREERAALEHERRDMREQIARYPQLQVEVSELRSQMQSSTASLSEIRKALRDQEDLAAKLERQLEAERSARVEAEKRASTADGRAKSVAHELDQLQSQALNTKDEWTAAVRLLRDRLAAANDKLKKQAEQHGLAQMSWKEMADMAVQAERQQWQSLEAEWAKDRSRLEGALRNTERQLHSEQARADGLAAEVKGLRSQCDDLNKALFEARSTVQSLSRKQTSTLSSSQVPRRIGNALVAVGGSHGLMRMAAAAPTYPPVMPMAVQQPQYSPATMHTAYVPQPMAVPVPAQNAGVPMPMDYAYTVPPHMAAIGVPMQTTPATYSTAQPVQHSISAVPVPAIAVPTVVSQPLQSAPPIVAHQTEPNSISAATTRSTTPLPLPAVHTQPPPAQAQQHEMTTPKSIPQIAAHSAADFAAPRTEVREAAGGNISPAERATTPTLPATAVGHRVPTPRSASEASGQRGSIEAAVMSTPPSPTHSVQSKASLARPAAAVSGAQSARSERSRPASARSNASKPGSSGTFQQTSQPIVPPAATIAPPVKVVPVDEYIQEDISIEYGETRSRGLSPHSARGKQHISDYPLDNEFMGENMSRHSHHDDASEASQEWF